MTYGLNRFSATLFLIVSCLMLSACGFHLRGSADIAEPLRQLTLVMPDRSRSSLEPLLRRQFEANGIRVNGGPGYQLEINSESRSRREASLGANADIDEYELTRKVSFLVRNPQGEIVLERKLTIERTYDYDADRETASSVQETQLYSEMEQQLASQILRFYANIKP
ncbi:LPS assembly lipoprotein LptE [Amphritea sp.]|uniref:LPS-assembly lipoprotein LptE n=1 Tax=Amphritea sp. TaxID=1872502 RepID=UPI0025C336FE|nr:LPS assembly lipoprotein LptE [Amphritea sp.]